MARLRAVCAGVILSLGAVLAPGLVQGQVTAQPGETFGDWIYECASVGDNQQSCALNQTLVDQASGNPLLKFSLSRDAQSGAVALVALVPLGIDFAAGVSGAVDEGAPFRYGLRTCVGTTCVAMVQVAPEALEQLKGGSRLRIAFTMFGEAQQRVFAGSLRGVTAGAAAAGF